MFAEAYLLKNALFTFDLPQLYENNFRKINIVDIQNHYCFIPVDSCNASHVFLASKLEEIFSDVNETLKVMHLVLTSNITGNNIFKIKLVHLQTKLKSAIFRNMLISLGDQMQVKLELKNAEVELPSVNPMSSVTAAVLKWNDREGQIRYYGNTDKFPERWAKYWLTRLKMKFSVQVSIIICGDLVLQMPNDLVGIFDATLGLDDEKESIPKKLLEDKIATNVTIITPGGMKVECHKSFLIAQSQVFQTMLNGQNYKDGESQEIEMVDMCENGVKALLAFLYYRGLQEPSKDIQVALELLRAANKYDISSLEKAITVIIMQKPIEWFDISTTIQLFFFSKNIDHFTGIKQKSLQVLKFKRTELTASNEYKQLFEDVDDDKRVAARELSNPYQHVVKMRFLIRSSLFVNCNFYK